MKRLIFITILSFIIGALWNAPLQGRPGVAQKVYSGDFKKEQARLAALFASKGAAQAYRSFREAYPSYEPLNRHYLGHFMGDKIYEYEGEKGIGLCDSNFEFGCVHGFVMAGVVAEGKGFLDRVEKACRLMKDKVSFEKCIHGVGHGVASYNGYGDRELVMSLAECKRVSPVSPSICYNGVFMEYNLRPMDRTDMGVIQGRRFDPAHPNAPCDSLDADYQPDCYTELGSWWSNVIPDKYEDMGTYCNQLPQGLSRNNCFMGVGRTVTDVNHFDVQKIASQCRRVGAQDGVARCLMGAMGVMITEGEAHALDACAFAPEAYRNDCRAYGEIFWCNERGECGKKLYHDLVK